MCRELTRDERKGIRKLVTEMCANYDRDYGCLPLDCECYMLGKWWTGAYCRYFREAVLPLDPVLLLPHVDDIFHIRETFAFQVSALAGLQFRKHGIGHLHKVTVLFAIDDAEGMHVGVLAEIFQLGLFLVGIIVHTF